MAFEREFTDFLDDVTVQAFILARIRARTGYNEETINRDVSFARGRINFVHPRYTLDHTEQGITGVPGAFYSRRGIKTAFQRLPGGGVRRLWHVPVQSGIPAQEIAYRFAESQAAPIARQLLDGNKNYV